MRVKLCLNIGRLKLKNPVMAASGTFGYAEEFAGFMDVKKLGAVVTKTITLAERRGNPMPRTAETASGMINSIGLENPGLEAFLGRKLPVLAKIGVPIIVSIASEGGLEEFVLMAKRLNKVTRVSAIELNISCPNIRPQRRLPAFQISGVSNGTAKSSSGGILVAQDPKATFAAVRAVRRVTTKPLITKLSPNVTDITEVAGAAVSAGTDALSLINTFFAMAVDAETRAPKLAAVLGGLSGPAIKPVALRMVWEVARRVRVPVIGMGGIMNTADALEFIIAGAAAVAVGSANFIQPRISAEIADGIKAYLVRNKINDIHSLIGSLKV